MQTVAYVQHPFLPVAWSIDRIGWGRSMADWGWTPKADSSCLSPQEPMPLRTPIRITLKYGDHLPGPTLDPSLPRLGVCLGMVNVLGRRLFAALLWTTARGSRCSSVTGVTGRLWHGASYPGPPPAGLLCDGPTGVRAAIGDRLWCAQFWVVRISRSLVSRVVSENGFSMRWTPGSRTPCAARRSWV